jgi:hypothetical protein
MNSKELKKLVKLVTQARNAVKNAGNQIAEAHAQSVAYDLAGREIIGHLRDLNDGLYGLAIHCQREVERAALRQVELDTPETGKVVPRARWPHGKPDTAGERAWLRKHAAADGEGAAQHSRQAVCDPVQSLGAPCPKCQRHVVGLVGAINSCGNCGAFLRRADTGEWFEPTAEKALLDTAGRQFGKDVRKESTAQFRKRIRDTRRNQKG